MGGYLQLGKIHRCSWTLSPHVVVIEMPQSAEICEIYVGTLGCFAGIKNDLGMRVVRNFWIGQRIHSYCSDWTHLLAFLRAHFRGPERWWAEKIKFIMTRQLMKHSCRRITGVSDLGAMDSGPFLAGKGQTSSLMARHKSVNPEYTKYGKSFASENGSKLLNINFRLPNLFTDVCLCT